MGRVRFFSRRNWRGQRRWYMTVRARNGEALAQGEAYNTRRARMAGLVALAGVLGARPGTIIPVWDEDAGLPGGRALSVTLPGGENE